MTNSQHSFEIATPRPAATYSQIHNRNTSGDISAEIASHVHHFSPVPNLALPPVDPVNRLSSSPGLHPPQNRFSDNANELVTPRKPRKRLEEAFSGQTATPPASRSKGSRKLAPKILRDTMQNDYQDGQYGSSQTPTHQSAMMSFTQSPGDFLSYPMSAPAGGLGFDGAKQFQWDVDSSMGGMDLDFNVDDIGGMFSNTSHKATNSFDWGRNNQIFQESVNLPPEAQNTNGKGPATKRQRPLAPKLPVTSTDMSNPIPPFNFNNRVVEDPFSMANMVGGVDPGLLYSRLSSQSSMVAPVEPSLPFSRPATSHTELRPYQHQLRESRRDQEELRRSRSSRSNSGNRRSERGTVSSPIRSSRNSLQRSVSDTRVNRVSGNMLEPSAPILRPAQDRVMISRSGRISPVKQRPNMLTSIPELHPPRTRTEVKFTIDANGRARTETVTVEAPRSRGGSLRGAGYDKSPYDSSSDEDSIVVSRNSSFALPGPPSLSRFESSRSSEVRRHSSSGYSQSESSSQRSYRQGSVESEAETVLEEDDGSGDATRE